MAEVKQAEPDEHYEEVSEYRIGEGPPPLFLVLAFIFVLIWALFSPLAYSVVSPNPFAGY
jgi:hypothetical protein